MERPTRVERAVGRYRLQSVLGKGGMAEVWLAADTVLQRRVAVKMILPALATDATFRQRFHREAQLVAALEHPHILPIYDIGEHEGCPYLVMPLLEGGSLARYTGHGGLPARQVCEWVRQLAGALDTAHAAGILHRDVKPSNVLLGQDERPMLSDFGIARQHGATSDLTTTGMLLGTPLYMAPELAQGGSASAASDIYALGVLAYEMLTGRPPFQADNPLAVLNQHVTQPVPSVRERLPDLPPDTDRVFLRVLAKQSGERPASGTAFAAELEAALGVTDAVAAAPRRAATVPSLAAEFPRARRRRPIWTVALGAALLSLAALFLWQRPAAEPPPEPPNIPAVEPRPAADSVPVPVGEATPEAVAEPLAEIPVPAPGPQPAAVPQPAPIGAMDLVRQVGAHLQRPGKLDGARFARWAASVQTLGAGPASERLLGAIAAFVDGGVAYNAGDDDTARAALARVQEALAAAQRSGAGDPAWADFARRDPGELADWELALIYGDGRDAGLPAVAARLAEAPDDGRARVAQVQLEHANGRHERALALAGELHALVAGRDARAAAVIGTLVGDEYADLGRTDDAIAAYRTAGAGAALFRAAELERARGETSAARALYAEACAAGHRQACQQAGSGGRRRGQGPFRRGAGRQNQRR